MTTKSVCKGGGDTRANGNCTNPAPDGLPAQCVGQWAADKHHYLQQYIEATHAVRTGYLPPKGQGGAAFIDLFAGPGVVRVRETGEIRDGSPMVASRHREAPFTRLVYCDLDPENVGALRARSAAAGSRVSVVEGDCNEKIEEIASLIPEHGLNIALVDPFALQALKFSTLKRLAAFKRMDLVVHFPTADIKRNLGQNDRTKRWLNEALGTDEWAAKSASMTDVALLIDVFKKQLGELGYQSQNVRSEPIKNSQNVPLYYLVYASKSERGDKIWQSVTKNKPSGQRGWGLRAPFGRSLRRPAMPVTTKRWNDPIDPDDGHRLLVCGYRPRGVRKDAETWDAWCPQLGPSRELHADYYGKHGPPIRWPEFRRRYVAEMNAEREKIVTLAARVVAGETITLLCSSACTDPERCHRIVLRKLVEDACGSASP